VLLLLQKEMNFTTEVVKRFDAEWGRILVDENGQESWIGMVQSLMEGDADLIVTSLTMTPQRCMPGITEHIF